MKEERKIDQNLFDSLKLDERAWKDGRKEE